MTNTQCVMDKVEGDHLKYDGIVFLTDCEFDWPMPRDVNRICIVKARGGRGNIPAWCKFGMEMDDLMRGVA
jgi:hypothetical protein